MATNANRGGVSTKHRRSRPAQCASRFNDSAVAPQQPQPQALTNDFAVMPYSGETPGSSLVYVTGIVRNLSDRQRFGIKLEFGLSDTNDTPLARRRIINPCLNRTPSGVSRPWSCSKAAAARLNSMRKTNKPPLHRGCRGESAV